MGEKEGDRRLKSKKERRMHFVKVAVKRGMKGERERETDRDRRYT